MPAVRPTTQPLGLHLTRTARAAAQAFDRAMAGEGGSASIWQVLLLVRSGDWSTQSQLARAMGVTGATLTHHLKSLEADGLVRRWREPDNGRVQRVELTPDGEELFERLRAVAKRHDERLRGLLSAQEADQLRRILDRLDAGLHDPGDTGV
jgi:MarR family transcriptional regulator, transcriptional regulator for hemolysin